MAKTKAKRPGHDWNRFKETGEVSPHWRLDGQDSAGCKNAGGSWFAVSHNNVPHSRGDALKGGGGSWFGDNKEGHGRKTHSGSSARKAAAATIAKIPLPLSRYIGSVYRPLEVAA